RPLLKKADMRIIPKRSTDMSRENAQVNRSMITFHRPGCFGTAYQLLKNKTLLTHLTITSVMSKANQSGSKTWNFGLMLTEKWPVSSLTILVLNIQRDPMFKCQKVHRLSVRPIRRIMPTHKRLAC